MIRIRKFGSDPGSGTALKVPFSESELLTVGVEESLGYLEPLVSVLVVESVGELVGHMRNGAHCVLRVGNVVYLRYNRSTVGRYRYRTVLIVNIPISHN